MITELSENTLEQDEEIIELQSTDKIEIKTDNMKSIFSCWNEAIRNFFEVSGRTTRYEFWAFQTVSLFIFLAAALIGFAFDAYKIVFEIYAAYFIAPFATVCVRRLHDINLSGWFAAPAVLFAVMLLIFWELELNMIMPQFLLLSYVTYLFCLLAAPGEKQNNKYGARVLEADIYNQDSQYFINFITVFMAVLWVCFFVSLY